MFSPKFIEQYNSIRKALLNLLDNIHQAHDQGQVTKAEMMLKVHNSTSRAVSRLTHLKTLSPERMEGLMNCIVNALRNVDPERLKSINLAISSCIGVESGMRQIMKKNNDTSIFGPEIEKALCKEKKDDESKGLGKPSDICKRALADAPASVASISASAPNKAGQSGTPLNSANAAPSANAAQQRA